MIKINRYLPFALLPLLFALTAGCWDRTEINDLAIVMATGVDYEKDGLYRVSIESALPGQMGGPSGGGGGTSGNKSYYIDSDTGKTLREANEKIQSRMARKIYLPHRRVIVVGEELAQKKGIIPLFDELSRVPQNRLTAYMIIAKGKAYELLNAQPKFERFSGEAIREIVKSRSLIPTNLKSIAQAINHNGSDAIVPYMGVKQSEKNTEPSQEIEVLGYAQFRDGKMVAVLEKGEADGIQWLLNNVRPHFLTIKEKNGYTTLKITHGSTKIKPELDGNTVHFTIQAEAEAEVMENLKDQDLTRKQTVQQLEQEISANIEAEIRATFAAMKERKADSANLGMLTYWHYPRQWQEHFMRQWPEVLSNSTASVHVRSMVLRFGLTSENIAEKESHQ